MSRTERLAQPEEFGKYHLVARLARGRMTDVYKAKSHGVEGFEKIQCVKIFRPELTANEAFVDIVIEEAKRSVALSHANIAQVLDLGHEEDQQKYYVAMEYIAGLDLARALSLAETYEHPWPQEMSVFIASEVGKAMDYAHRRKDFNFNNLNILHRSLRPENIMLSYDGEVKITDFGLSRAMEAVPVIDESDISERVLYAAPEVARGEPYTRQSDIFSIGLVLYELLAGFHPYRSENADEVRERACQGRIPPIGEHAEVPRQLQQILESMLVHDPAGRAQSAGQLYEELIGYLFGNSLQADNRMLALTMQELRRREQNPELDEVTQEFGLDEISSHELASAFKEGGVFHSETSETLDPESEAGVTSREVPRQALPSSSLPSQSSNQGASSLPGPLEELFQSVVDGNGKALLLSGRMGRGREVLLDRLVDAVDQRPDSSSRLIHTSNDDRFRPFGVFSDLVLRSLHETVKETLDHRQEALATLDRWGVGEEARETMASLWQLDDVELVEQSVRRRHLLQIVWVMLENFARQGPFVLVIDRVERLDQVSRDILRDLIASIGDLQVLLVLGTQAQDAMRSLFDAGRPEDLEAIRVSGDEPPTPDELSGLSQEAVQLLTLLSLADRTLPISALSSLLDTTTTAVHRAAEELIGCGAMRIPRPGRYRSDVPNWLTWRENQDPAALAPLAATLARYFVHRLARNEADRLTPTLLRLYAIAGDRRHLLGLAGSYGNWLEQNAWQQTALTYYQHLSELLGAHGLGLPHVRVRFVLQGAEMALEMALIDTCRSLLEPLNALTETTRDEEGFVGSQLLLGQLAMQQDDIEEGRAHFKRSIRTARSLKDPALLARSSLALAGWHERFGAPEAALKYLESAVNVDARRIGPKTRATLLQQAAKMWADRGMVRRAMRPAQDLHTLSTLVAYPSVRCRAYMALAHLAASQGDHGAASGHYDLALGLANSHGLVALAIELLRQRAGMCVRFDRHEEAVTWANQVVGFAEQYGDYYSEQRARDLRALAQSHIGQEVEAAITQLRASLRRATERGVPKDVYRGHDYLARAFIATGRDDEARHHRTHADELRRQMRMSWAA